MKALIAVLLGIAVIPAGITELILRSCSFLSEKEKRIGTGIRLVIHAVFFLVVITLLYRTNPITELRNLLTLNCSYQDIAKLGISGPLCLLNPVLAWNWRRKEIRRRGDCAGSFHQKGIVMLMVTLMISASLLAWVVSLEGNRRIRLSGFCRRTEVISEREDAAEEEEVSFVTIRNDGVLAFEAKNLYVSDREENPLYCRLDSGTIGPGEELTTYITMDDSLDIRKNGGSAVWLSNAAGQIMDRITLPPLAKDEAYVKTGDEWSVVSLVKEQVSLSAPEFSAESGFYESAFDLTLSSEKGMKIYYTLDCSDPTAESTLYTGPIHVCDRSAEENKYRSIRNVMRDYPVLEFEDPGPVDKAFIVRAIAVDEDGNASKPITKSYFINLEKYRDHKVVSLVSDPANLFDPETGIYVTGTEYDEWYRRYLEGTITLEEGQTTYSAAPTPNFRKRGEEWERQANLELMDGQNLILSQPVGIRIQGTSSAGFPLKRFSVYSRKQYSGNRYFDQPILGDFPTHSFVLRDGYLNAFTQTLTPDRDTAIQRSIPVTVFLDGEFWYNTYIQEKYSGSYFAEHLGLNPDNIAVEKSLYYSRLMEAIEAFDASDEEGYAKIGEFMDIQSYIDFVCINAYLDNEDTCDEKNILMWKSYIEENGGPGDGRWRWALYDMDLLWKFDGRDHTEEEPAYAVNTFTLGMAPDMKEDYTLSHQALFVKLRENTSFQRQFVLTFMDLVNTDFRPDAVIAELEAFEDWGEAAEAHYEFFRKRPEYIVPYMAEEFALTGTPEPVTLISDRPESVIQLNTITPDLKDGFWSGQYYTDVPVTVSCEDSRFDHWVITSGGTTETRTEPFAEVPVSKGGVQIHAVFR